MKNIKIGIIAGVILGLLDILIVLPIPLPNKMLVLIGTFSNRFAIGLFTATADLNVSYPVRGLIVGFLMSILPAVSNPGFAIFILGTGTVAGLITGFIIQKLTKTKSH